MSATVLQQLHRCPLTVPLKPITFDTGHSENKRWSCDTPGVRETKDIGVQALGDCSFPPFLPCTPVPHQDLRGPKCWQDVNWISTPQFSFQPDRTLPQGVPCLSRIKTCQEAMENIYIYWIVTLYITLIYSSPPYLRFHSLWFQLRAANCGLKILKGNNCSRINNS